MPDLTPLAEYGLAGVCLALIILVGLIIRWILKLVGNHFTSNTKALEKMTNKLDEDITAQKEASKTFKELKEFLMLRNGKK